MSHDDMYKDTQEYRDRDAQFMEALRLLDFLLKQNSARFTAGEMKFLTQTEANDANGEDVARMREMAKRFKGAKRMPKTRK